jgi:hypothetical protein
MTSYIAAREGNGLMGHAPLMPVEDDFDWLEDEIERRP